MTSLEANKRLARLYFEAAQTGDLAVFDDIIADDFTVHAIHGKYSAVISPTGDERGPARLKQFAAEWNTIWRDAQVSIDEIVAEGDRVIVQWTFSGTQRGEFLGIPPTNKRVTYSGFNIFRVADGKLAEAWDMMDRFGMWQQLGLLPPTAEFIAKARTTKLT